MQLQLPLTYGTLAVTPANMKAISGTAGELVVHMATPQQLAVSTAMSVDALPATVPGNAGAMGAEWGRRLLAAARAGDTALVRALVARGAPFAADWLGAGPLHAAASAGHADTVAALLRAGVSRDARTKVERTPLHLAAYGGHLAAARALLAAGAAAAARDLLAMTPLHWAAERGHAAVAALLLRHGADPRAKSKFLKTPLQLARDPAVAALLQEAARAKENMASVAAVVNDRGPEGELTDTEPDSDPIHVPVPAAVSTPRRARVRREPPHAPLSDIKIEPGATPTAADGADNVYGLRGGAAGAAGARLLRAHGITLLPADSGSTVLTALQSGRTVMLSDAGKLMLKESGHTPTVPTAAGPTVPTVPPSQADVVLRAAPVRHAPAKGVKVFTLAAPNTETTTTATTPAGTPPSRPTVKIFVNRANLDRLVPRQDSSKQDSSSESDGETVSVSIEGAGPVRVPRRFLRSRSPTYLRARLLAAHAALRAMGTQLADAQARIAALEANQQ